MLSVGTLIAGLLLVRYLGPRDFGLYTLAISVGSIVSSVADAGLTRYAARVVSADPREGRSVVVTGLSFTLTLLIPAVIVLIGAAIRGNLLIACGAAGVLIGNLQRLASLGASLLNAELRSRSILLGSFVGRVGTIACTLAIIVLHSDVLWLLLLLALLSLLVAGVRIWQSRHYCPNLSAWRFSTVCLTSKRAWPYFSYSLTEVAYGQLTVLCLALVASREAVGWFAAALTISSVFPQWTYSTSDALLPVMTRLFESRRTADLTELRRRVLEVLLIVSVPVSVLLSLFAPEICHLLGPKYSSSGPVLRLLAFGGLLSVMEGLGGAFLVSADCILGRRKALITSVLVMIVLTTTLGWRWGALGAAVSLIVARFVIISQYLSESAKINLPVEWVPSVLHVSAAGAVMALAAVVVSHFSYWPIAVAPALFAYLLVLWLLTPHSVSDSWRTLRGCVTGAF